MASRVLVLLVLAGVTALSGPARAGGEIADARRDIAALRFDLAESRLVDVARRTRGTDKQEALFLLAGLKRNVSEAQIIYQEVIQINRRNEWADRSHIELAKIQYALGNYGRAFSILNAAQACRTSDEACYFQGISAVMMKQYERARETLNRIRKGRYRAWAFLSLAEIEMREKKVDEACQKYRSMARSSISPTAMYRYGECLEKEGRAGEARRQFEEIITRFKQTPEALLAGEKLTALSEADRPARRVDHPDQAPLSSGFTIQFGAFHDRMNAIKLAATLKRRLPGVRIDSNLLNNREVHRVRLGYFATRADAEHKAQEVSKVVSEAFTILTLP